MSYLLRALALIALVSASAAYALPQAKPGEIEVTVEGMEQGAAIPEDQALCTPTKDGKSDKVKAPLRPTIRWSKLPKDTATVAIFMMDPDVPADFTDAGKEGKKLAKTAKRQDFFHYALVDVPPSASSLPGDVASKEPSYGRELVNDLGLNGYVEPPHAYGGPCPPWNDERVHHYHFIVLALDRSVSQMPTNMITAKADEKREAKRMFDGLMASKHVLGKGTAIGTYTLNAKLRKADK